MSDNESNTQIEKMEVDTPAISTGTEYKTDDGKYKYQKVFEVLCCNKTSDGKWGDEDAELSYESRILPIRFLKKLQPFEMQIDYDGNFEPDLPDETEEDEKRIDEIEDANTEVACDPKEIDAKSVIRVGEPITSNLIRPHVMDIVIHYLWYCEQNGGDDTKFGDHIPSEHALETMLAADFLAI